MSEFKNNADKKIFRFVKGVILFGVLALVIVFVLSACGQDKGFLNTTSVKGKATPAASSAPASTPSNPPSSSPAGSNEVPVGKAAVIGDNQNHTEGSVKVDSIHVTQLPADPEFGDKPANGWYVIVHVTAKADPGWSDGFDVNTFDFEALSPGGRQFQEDDGNAYEALNNGQVSSDITATLGAGQSASGWLAFDVNRPHGQIAYAPNYNGQPICFWRY